jgi:hypothetical protein
VTAPLQRQAHIEKHHSPSPPARGGPPQQTAGADGRRASASGAGPLAHVRGGRAAGDAGMMDANPWAGGARGEAADGSQQLVVGGGTVNRVARTVGATSAR